MTEHTIKKKLFGIGAGYDYSFYHHSSLHFFTGINTSYQWFENRMDLHYFENIVSEYGQYVKESIYDYWDRVRGVVISPNVGVRFSTDRVMIESRINVPISILNKKSHSFYQTKNAHESSWAIWEGFYPEKEMKDFEMQAGGSIHLYYMF